LTLARNAQKEFLIGQSSRSHATYRPTISGWLLVCKSRQIQKGHSPCIKDGACVRQVLPKVFWEECVALAQVCNRSPLVTVERPKFATKTALPLRRLPPPSNTPDRSIDPNHHPNSIWIHSAILPQCLSGPTDRQTHRPATDGPGDRATPISLMLYCIDGQQCAKR